MAKKSENRILMILNIFKDGVIWYCKYLDVLLKYMLFPVLGQILGLVLIFTANYFFVVNIPHLIKQYPILDNIPLVFTLLLICVFPGFLVFCKAFYDYIIAMGSLNSMAYVSRGEKMKSKPLDTKTHDDILKKRLGKYIILVLMFSLLALIGAFPLFIIPFAIVCVYLSLILQVFMLEESTPPLGAFRRSFDLVKTNFGITCLLLGLSGALTYWLLPNLIVWAFDKASAINYLAYPIFKYLEILPIDELVNSAVTTLTSGLPLNIPISVDVNSAFNIHDIACSVVRSLIGVSVIGLLLPMRSCWFTLLYKTLDFEKGEELRKTDYKKEYKNRNKKG